MKNTNRLPIYLAVLLTTITIVLVVVHTKRKTETNPITIQGVTYEYSRAGVWVAVFTTPLELSNSWSDGPSLEDGSRLQNYLVSVNGTYFKGSYDKATPAGFFQEEGVNSSQVLQDKQLTRIVSYSASENKLVFSKVNEYITGGSDFAFQTGPQILTDGVIEDQEISNSINGLGSYKRTFLGKTSTGSFVFGTATSPISLLQLGAVLKEMQVFKGQQITVVNLDGGPSTAMYSKDFDRVNWNTTMRLPLIIGTRP